MGIGSAIVSDQPANEKFFDLTFITSISKGDKEFARKIIVIFQETMPTLLDSLIKASAGQKFDLVSKTAHKMKANIDLLGIHSLRDVIRKLESAELTATEISSYVEKVKYILKEVFVQLHEYV